MKKEEKIEKKDNKSLIIVLLIIAIITGAIPGYFIGAKYSKQENQKIEENKQNNNNNNNNTDNNNINEDINEETNREDNENINNNNITDEIVTYLDFSKECFNKKETCTKEFSLNNQNSKNIVKIEYSYDSSKEKLSNKEKIKVYINNNLIIDNPYGYKLIEMAILDSNTFVLKSEEETNNNLLSYFSSSYNLIEEFNEEDIIPLDNVSNTILSNNFKDNTYEYSFINDSTIKVSRLNTNTGSNSNNGKSVVKEFKDECFNDQNNCEKNYELNNGIININIKIRRSNNKLTAYYNNDLILDNENDCTIKINRIALLDNNLLALDTDNHCSNTDTYFSLRKYINEKKETMFSTAASGDYYEEIDDNITNKEILFTKAESGCTTDFENRITHTKKYKIINENEYTIEGIKTNKEICAGQS